MEVNFLDELLQEAEAKEEKLSLEYADLTLLEISQLEKQIQANFEQAARECEIIKNWALMRNSKLVSRLEFLSKKLEVFIKESGEKTINLPFGILKMHKKPDKVEIENLELFLKKAKPEMLTIVPESYKPDMNKIKAYIKSKPVPAGVKVIEGREEFSYKLREESEEENNNGRTKETGTGVEQNNKLRVVV